MTQHFTISEEDRKKLAPYHRAFQATVAQHANQFLGLNHPPQGIGRYQGGLTINGKMLVINPNNVDESWSRTTEPTREEVAVATALVTVTSAFKLLGQKALIAPPPEGVFGSALKDPLRWFFEGPGGTKGIKLQ